MKDSHHTEEDRDGKEARLCYTFLRLSTPSLIYGLRTDTP